MNRRHFISRCALLPSAAVAAAGRPAGLMLNHSADAMFDPMVAAHFEESMSAAYIELTYQSMMDRYAGTQVSDVLLNVNFQRACFDSRVWDRYWDNREWQELPSWHRQACMVHRKGVDAFAVCVERCRKNGLSPWMSIRMNDLHYVRDPRLAGTLWWKRPDFRVTPNGAFNFAVEAVREHHMNLIREVLERYDVNGLELDWMRFPPYFKAEQAESSASILTDFTRQVRQLCVSWSQRRAHPVALAARVPARPAFASGFGLDAAAWVKEGIIDVLIPASIWTPVDTDIHVEDWRAAIGSGAPSYTLAAGTDLALQGMRGGLQMRNNRESMRGFTAASLHRGADRIYLFNHFNYHKDFTHVFRQPDGREVMRDEYRSLLSEAAATDTIAGQARRHVLTYADSAPPGMRETPALPVEIGGDVAAKLRIYCGPRPQHGPCVIRLGLADRPGVASAQVSVRLNGTKCTATDDLKSIARYVPMDRRTDPFVWSVAEVAPRVVQFAAPPASFREGYNDIGATAESGSHQIVWAEILVPA